jgi:hypothetical protein
MMRDWRSAPSLAHAAIGAIVLSTIPLWTLPLLAAGKRGFLAYLTISDTYYRGAAALLGPDLFPRHEFGTVPRGAAGLFAAVILYGALGAVLGLVIGAVRRAR